MTENSSHLSTLADQLVIITPLCGRPKFTLRHLLYLEAVHCPFKVFFADGSLDDQNRALIEANRQRFPHVRYVYHRYPADKGWNGFYKKMVDALRHINAPYVLWYDNDDFFAMDLCCQSIAFLNQDIHQHYVGCISQQREFSKKSGKRDIEFLQNIGVDYNYALDTPRERFSSPFLNDGHMNGVFRYAIFRESFIEMVKNNQRYAYGHDLWLLIPGKIHVFPACYQYKQSNTGVWMQDFFPEDCLTTTVVTQQRALMTKIVDKIGIPKHEKTSFIGHMMLAYYGVRPPKTWRDLWNLHAQLGSVFFEKIVKIYSIITLWKFRRWLKHQWILHRHADNTLRTMQHILKTAPSEQ